MVEQEDEAPDPRAAREERILDAAAELIQRWGYKKTTIEDIAQQAGVGKGTIYLHWKTRDDLFIALLLRERLRALQDVEEHLATDPDGVTLHGVAKYFTRAVLTNPLLRAALQHDTAMWSDLLRTKFVLADTQHRLAAGRGGLASLRGQHLIRDDDDLDDQVAMLAAISTGFLLLNHYLPPEQQLSVEHMSELVARVIQRTFAVKPAAVGGQDAQLMFFHELLNQTRDLSRKKVE